MLKQITEEKPLYPDEIQVKVFHRTGKLFSPSTISRHLWTINYSLKLAVLRAKQQKEEAVNAYYIRMAEWLEHPSQLLFIDESARDELAFRRTRAYSPVCITPIVVAPMVPDFYSWYTFFCACNWEGFITEACTIVEREHGKMMPILIEVQLMQKDSNNIWLTMWSQYWGKLNWKNQTRFR